MSIRETYIPEDHDAWKALRALDLTSTESAALFGVSPYSTKFELFHRKREKQVVELQSNDRMLWGQRLETVIAQGIAEDQGWKIRKMSEYVRMPGLRLGASFDFSVEDLNAHLEVKSVDSLAFKEGWLAEGDDIEAPPHIEIQVQHQMLVSGREQAFIGALVGGNRVVLLERKANPAVQNAIKAQAALFWAQVDKGEAPAPDFTRDSDFICNLYQSTTAGKVIDATEDKTLCSLLDEYRETSEAAKALSLKKDELKARILMAVGDAEKAIGPRFTLSLGLVKGGPVSYTREQYRMFKPYWKKEKKT